MLKVLTHFTLLVIFYLAQIAVAQESDIDVNVDSISTVGRWKIDGQEGVYRFIIYEHGNEHVRGELLIQWLRWEIDEQGLYTNKVLAAEIPVKEINSLGFALKLPECNGGWPCPEFTILALSTFESEPNKRFLITPIGIGSYEIEEVEL